MPEEERNTLALARDVLLEMAYGVIRDIDILTPKDRNGVFLIRNLKARLEHRVALTRDRDPVLASELEHVFDELYHASFPIKKQSPTLVTPSSLPNAREPDESA